MGSCVSQCSRQDVIHQQSNRIADHIKNSIEIQEGIPIDEKDLEAHLSKIVKDYAAEIKADDNTSSLTDRDRHPTTEQFNYEMRALRQQLMRSQVLFSYLLRDSQTEKSQKSAENQYRHDELLEGTRFRNLSNISSGSYASHRSTPIHASFNSLSCPQLPSATQAEILTCIQKKDDATKHVVTENICEIHEEPEAETVKTILRNRTDSFLAAVNDGNLKMVEAGDATEQQRDNSHQTSFVSENGNKMVSQDITDCVFPRKLSILLEEDYEDSSGNHYSICNSKPFASRKRKVLPSCNAKTQTDLTLCTKEPPVSKHISIDKRTSPEPPTVREIYQQRHGYSIVAQAVQKRTVYSEELPKKLVTRYPPPYTNKLFKHNAYMSSDHIYFKELASRPKTHIYKWATVAESLPSKSDSFQFLTHKSSNDPNLQTRHLSLEKQESYSSSCDHSIYPESQMSSVTDCSGWMTKSDVDINLHHEYRVEPPSYVQSILSIQKNRQEILPIKQMSESGVPKPAMETIKKEEKSKSVDIPSIEENNNKGKDVVKSAPRSARRMSTGSSDNALLCIPRYPAFDFSEQEDVQPLPQSPVESSKDESAKVKTLQGGKDVESIVDRDKTQKSSGVHKKESTTTKKRETTKTKTLMPELVENSETESAKGSFECEVPYAPPTADQAPAVQIETFPSLSSPGLISSLTNLGILNESSIISMPIDEKEIEAAVASLALRFKTDMETLQTREERRKLKRDVAEENIDAEIEIMKNLLKKLNCQATTEKTRDMISSLQKHVDIIQKVTSSVSRESESYGAVQQEVRTSGIIKMLLQYVTHLKQVCDSERSKLEKTRRLLSDRPDAKLGAPEEHKKSLKTLGITVQSIKSVGRRRASVATFHQYTLPENSKNPGFSQSWSSGYSIPKEIKIPCSIQDPFSSISSVGMSSSSLATSPSSTSPSHSSNNTSEAKCLSLPTCDINSMIQTVPNWREATVQDFTTGFLNSHVDKMCRNICRRKLSLVADEKEQSSDEKEELKILYEKKFEDDSASNKPCLSFEFTEESNTDSDSSNESLNELSANTIKSELFETLMRRAEISLKADIRLFLNKWLHIDKVEELLRKNSYQTIFRYICSLILLLIAFCCFIVFIIFPIFEEPEEIDDECTIIDA